MLIKENKMLSFKTQKNQRITCVVEFSCIVTVELLIGYFSVWTKFELVEKPKHSTPFQSQTQARKREDRSIEFLIVCYENRNLQKNKNLVFWSQVWLPSFRVAQLSIVCTVWGTVETPWKEGGEKNKTYLWKQLETVGNTRCFKG